MPADHSIFERLNDAQWLWYYHNLRKDREEEFYQRRDLVEYHASFIEPEAVRKIRESREKAVEVSDQDFSTGLKRMFGRDFNVEKRASGKIESVDPRQAMTEHKIQKVSNKPVETTSYKHWLSSDLE